MNDHLLLPDFPRLSEWFGAWAVLPERAESLWAAVQNTDWPAHFAAFAQAPKPTADSNVGMVSTGSGNKNIAVIPLVGDLMKSRSSMGGTSTVQVRRDIRSAVRNPDVSGILLAIDSPGGTVSGTADLGAEIKAARRTKPVFAQIEDTGASAAYWIASQASRVYASSGTTIAGSIGTVLAVTKEASGKVQVFTSGPLKRPGADGTLTDEQASYLQGLVNGWQSQFDAAVKSGRRLTDKQLASVNSGAVFLANTALELKLIDGIQSTDQTLAELAGTK